MTLESRGGNSPDGRKVRGTIHWVSEKHSVMQKSVYMNTYLVILDPDSYKDGDFTDLINPDSVKILKL